jgi:hypothetical protein
MFRRLFSALLLATTQLVACASDPPDSGAPAEGIYIPGHNECLAEGEEMSEATCLAVVEDFGHYPTVSEEKTGYAAPLDDPRALDPEYLWLTAQIKRCTCNCCHHTSYGGPGAYFWDLDFLPVWTDSASRWSLSVLGGWTEEPDQTLPTEDLERVRAYIEGEYDRRAALDDQ